MSHQPVIDGLEFARTGAKLQGTWPVAGFPRLRDVLRTDEGISPEAFADRFGTTFESLFGTVVERLFQERLIESRADRWALTPRGLETSNSVFLHFLL